MTLIKFKDAPARRFQNMMNFNEFFNDFFDSSMMTDFRKSSVPAVNISESEAGYHLEMAAPGFSKDDFKLSVENDVLTVSAERKSETENKDKKFTRKEFSFSSFSRSFTLPETVNADQIQASYKDGLMMIDLPRKEEAKPQSPKVIDVK